MKNTHFILLIGLFFSINAYAQHNNSELPTSINTVGTAPDESSILDVQATDKGVLIPRMARAARDLISNPAMGLLIFQTDDTAGFYYYDGGAWTSLMGNPVTENTLDMAYDQGGTGAGRVITADAGAVEIRTSTANGTAFLATSSNTGVAVNALSSSTSNTFSTIQSTSNSNSDVAAAVFGNSTSLAWGVSGQVSSSGTATAAVYGSNLRLNAGHGVLGVGYNGVVGETENSNGIAVWGENFHQTDPFGNGTGVVGRGKFGMIGQDITNGVGVGAYGVFSSGDFGSTGTKSFVIDHPQDPENKILRHFSVESDEVLNIYRGNAVFDDNGEAHIQLSDYYEAVNRNPSYQLTPIGAFANLYIKQEIRNGTFTIAGGQAGMKVSWAVYAERNDTYLQQNPQKRAVVVEKDASKKGRYLMPHLYDSDKDFFFEKHKTVTEQKELQWKK